MATTARSADVPFRPTVGPRDALTEDYDPDVDYVPDIDTKGYHAGLVRQPVRALVDPKTGNVVAFETVEPGEEDEAARPFGPSLDDLKRAHNRAESGWKEGQQYRAYAGPAAPTTIATETGKQSPATRARVAQLEAELAALREEKAGQSAGDAGGETKLTGDALDARGKELGIEGWSGLSADEKRAAVAAAEGNEG